MRGTPMRMLLSRLLKPVACASASLACAMVLSSGRAEAGSIGFDPNGAAGGSAFLSTSVFDFAPGNSLFQGLGSILSNKVNQATNVYVQSKLGSLLDANAVNITPAGLNSSYEVTVVVGFSALATTAGNDTTYALANSPSVNYFNIYYDSNPATQSNDTTGTGFNDGTLILSGTLNSADGGFTRFGTPTRFDQFGPNDYVGTNTERVAGGAYLEALVTSADANFFDTLPPLLQLVLYNSSSITPFSQVNPAATVGGIAPNRGPINGQGADFQVQADANASVQVIPEPSTFVLGALGLVGACLAVRRRK